MSDITAEIDTIIRLTSSLRRAAEKSQQRRCLLVSGSSNWCFDVAKHIQNEFNAGESIWVSRQAPTDAKTLDNKTVFKSLGAEADLVVYNAHEGFDADAFGAISGIIRGGGILLLLTPFLSEWPQQYDPEAERFFQQHTSRHSFFIARFITIATKAEGVFQVTQDEPISLTTPNSPNIPIQHIEHGACRTSDQALAVNTINTMATSESPRPVVLISDRGRGKSSALGIAAAQLLQQGLKKIIITGPRLDSVLPVFEHARRLLSISAVTRGTIEYSNAQVEYVPPDELISSTPEADLLLVDEAAATPTPMLIKLLNHYHRIVFATTVHGYEGTGRGFALRFNKVLDQQTPDWQQIKLSQPIRWAEDDPLEKFVFDALLLNASIADENKLRNLTISECYVEIISHEQLIQNQKLLPQVFGLLVLAHYRTRPNDLRQLLDSPGMRLYVIRYRTYIIGTVLMIEEGSISRDISKLIYQGRRRLHGHLIPQSLATHAGIINAACLRYLRIMRIAIHPAVQSQGLGSKLVSEIIQTVKSGDADCVGTSFGVTTELYRFWNSLGFIAARLGITREHSSGTHSLIMLAPISKEGKQLIQLAQSRLQLQLPYLLTDILQNFDSDIERLLIRKNHVDTQNLSQHDWQDIISFAYGARGYEFCIAAITKFVITVLNKKNTLGKLNIQQQQLLQSRVVQKLAWAEVVEIIGLNGRNAAIRLLRDTLKTLIELHCPKHTRENINMLIDL